ncbi:MULTISPECIES: hypothetical protein [Bacillus cereus group]|uniref:hypothetical protein n=1 Tax=Bacillus cereus group TaxID=86661 RepID=UPI00065FD68A|nr:MULTISPECIES: hypothetical protein [Bacillus cereus group]AWC33263.1 hypothetical protein CG482_013340 [Bacillus cytotoxicus]AWC33822.1 hypothetical protein CG482_016395 [Bacillus cytotoxicus]AWC37812.1 hypothetical protein CG481_016225 [Bacillus cytotoxicus]AWC45796.1 hypothetical protein CG479_015640 [Bacillus cytotoxicus]AWC53896.1 hypothetical protein CG477_016650 [Bacillus cytotoxicus]
MAAPRPNPYALVLGEGAIIMNFGIKGKEVPLGALKGGGSFTYEPEFKAVEYNGSKGDTKGFKRIISSKTQMKTGGLLEFFDPKKVVNFFPGAEVSEVKKTVDGKEKTYSVITSREKVTMDSYLENIAFVGETADGRDVIIIVLNALNDSSIEAAFEGGEEMAPEATFTGHRDPCDLDKAPFEIWIEGGGKEFVCDLPPEAAAKVNALEKK